MVESVDTGDLKSLAQACGFKSRSGHRWWRAGLWIAGLGLMVGWYIVATDVFCLRGYRADDGMCAWE